MCGVRRSRKPKGVSGKISRREENRLNHKLRKISTELSRANRRIKSLESCRSKVMRKCTVKR